MKTVRVKSRKQNKSRSKKRSCKSSPNASGKCAGVPRKTKKRKSKKNKYKKKRKVNKFFKLMLNAKKNNIESFEYGGNTYIGNRHPKLGLIYKKEEI